jgi:hypothetical protein
VAAAQPLFEVQRTWRGGLVEAAADVSPGRIVVVDGAGRAAELTARDPSLVGDLAVEGRPPQWRGLDTAVLHHVLLERIWRRAEADVGYHHSAEQVAATLARDGGVGVLLAPVDVATVFSMAAQGVRMPRKTTSFGPKPRTGLVLRTLDDD